MRAPALALLLAVPPLPGAAEAAVTPDSVRSMRLATCAALWDGYSAVLGDEGEGALARRFEAQAARLMGGDPARAAVAERRPWMEDLLHAYIGSGDDQSRELFGRLLTDCAALEADLPG